MYTTVAIVAALTIGAEPFDRDQLRKAVGMPTYIVQPGLAIDVFGQIHVGESAADKRQATAAGELALRADPENPERCRELLHLYERTHEYRNIPSVRDRALRLYRARLDKQPNDGLTLARYAECLDWSKQADEADSALRRAVALAPGEWECWVIRSRVLIHRAMELVHANQEDPFTATQAIQTAIHRGEVSSATLAGAQALFDESFRCLDKAIAAAPKQPRIYIIRFSSLTPRFALDYAMNCLKGLPVDTISGFDKVQKQGLADLRRAADVAPDDFRIVGALICSELTAVKAFETSCPLEEIAGLSADTVNTIRRTMVRLEQVAAGANPADAVQAAELLAIITCRRKESLLAEDCLKQILRRDPSIESAWDSLVLLVAHRPNHTSEELVAICRDRLRHQDVARTRLVLAKAFVEANRMAEAKQELEEALRKEPDDFMCLIGLASVLLQAGNDADLKRVGELLDKADSIGKNPETSDRTRKAVNFAAPRIAYFALTGQFEQASRWFDTMSGLGWSDERVQKMKQILGTHALAPVPGIGVYPASGPVK
jgi:tetratricopeptide (TPR) repeat protein